MFVGLRFPTQPVDLADVFARRAICLNAQKQADEGRDVTAPDGVEIVFMHQPVAMERIKDIMELSPDPVSSIANGLDLPTDLELDEIISRLTVPEYNFIAGREVKGAAVVAQIKINLFRKGLASRKQGVVRCDTVLAKQVIARIAALEAEALA